GRPVLHGRAQGERRLRADGYAARGEPPDPRNGGLLSAARRVAAALVVCACAVVALPGAAAAPSGVTPGAYYKDGPSGRYLLGGTWLFRADGGVGLQQHFQSSQSTGGWSQITVPNAWNANQPTAAGYAPAVGWYRKDFALPSPSPHDTWIVRF